MAAWRRATGGSHRIDHLAAQRVAGRLVVMLSRFIGIGSRLEVFGPGVVPIDATSRLEPDVLAAGLDPAADNWLACRTRLLAVEVSGPGSRLIDETYKRDAYLAAGVREVWLVDLERRHVAVARSGVPDEVLRDQVQWQAQDSGPALTINVPELFLPRF